MLNDVKEFSNYLKLGIELDVLEVNHLTGEVVSTHTLKTLSDIDSIPVSKLLNSVGFGINLRKHNYVSIDIDNASIYHSSGQLRVPSIGDHFGIDSDYPWKVISGSHIGMHILFAVNGSIDDKASEDELEIYKTKFRKKYENNENFPSDIIEDMLTSDLDKVKTAENILYNHGIFNEGANKAFRSGSCGRYGRITIRRDGYYLLPPSLFLSGGKFEYFQNKHPTTIPVKTTNYNIFRIVYEFGIKKVIFSDNHNPLRLCSFSPIFSSGLKKDFYYSQTNQNLQPRISGQSLFRKTLIVDTETTGLPASNFTPDIIQVSWIVIHEYFQSEPSEDPNEEPYESYWGYHVKTRSFNVATPNIEPTQFIENLTGLNNDILKVTNCRELAMRELYHDLKGVDRIVGHNLEFDILFIEDFLNSKNDEGIMWEFDHLENYCTMKTPWLISNEEPQYLKLNILAERLNIIFNHSKLHNSLYDSYITLLVYEELALNFKDKDIKQVIYPKRYI